jgi:hypothetical protein
VTSYTVTATATNNTFTGGLLRVYVLDNATLAAPAVGSSTTAYNCSVTTTADGSYVIGIANNQSASTAFVAEGNCTITDQASVNAGGAQAAAFHTTSATTGTPGATTVGSTTTFAGSYGVVAMEAVSSGGTVSFDASAPAVVSSTTLTSFTTASFIPPSGTLLVATFVACGNGSANVAVATVSSTPVLTWTERIKINSTVDALNSYTGVWTASVPSNIVITPPSWAQTVAVVPFRADVFM